MTEPILAVRSVSKLFGSVIALSNVSAEVYPGEVTCLLGDNGAGKSTLIKIFAGVHQQTDGDYFFEGDKVSFSSPREALSRGIATVYQDLAMVPLMPIWRNFFLGAEPEKGRGPFKRYDIDFAKHTVREELGKMGIDIRDPDQSVGTLSGGERQSVAIARAVYFGAMVLILDEPTAALGDKQAGVVLKYILQARNRGIGVIFITHNPHHAYPVADHFVILRRGTVYGDYTKEELPLEQLVQMMAGGADLEVLQHELEQASREGEEGAEAFAETAEAIGSELEELGEDS